MQTLTQSAVREVSRGTRKSTADSEVLPYSRCHLVLGTGPLAKYTGSFSWLSGKTLEVGSPGRADGVFSYSGAFLAPYPVTASTVPARWELHTLDELLSRSQGWAAKSKVPQWPVGETDHGCKQNQENKEFGTASLEKNPQWLVVQSEEAGAGGVYTAEDWLAALGFQACEQPGNWSPRLRAPPPAAPLICGMALRAHSRSIPLSAGPRLQVAQQAKEGGREMARPLGDLLSLIGFLLHSGSAA